MFIFEGDVFLVNFPDGEVVPDVSRVGVVIERFRNDEQSAFFVVCGIEVGAAFEDVESLHVVLVAGLGREGGFVQVGLWPLMDSIEDVDVQVVDPNVESLALQEVIVLDESVGHVVDDFFGTE